MNKRKKALVTGGTSGIGLTTAIELVKNNYEVTITGRDEKQTLDLSKEYGFDYFICDFSEVDKLDNIATKFEEGLDLLVNNAGCADFAPISDLSIEGFDKNFHINVYAPMRLCQLLLPALSKTKGSIINVSSIITNNGKPQASLYAATKGALDAVTRSLALELAPLQVRVNAISPGAIDTPIIYKYGIPEEEIPKLKKIQEQMIPMGRFGYAREVADAILAMANNSYVTGSIWNVDGGVSAS